MKIVLLGSGNVATHLGAALKKAGHDILQIWSRTKPHAEKLAGLLNAEAITDTREITSKADIYILSVKDDIIAKLASGLPKGKLLVHTSGSTDLKVFQGISERFGVIYPIQTLSKHKAADFHNVPLFVEGSAAAVTQELLAMAGGLSGNVKEMSSDKRLVFHIAAVFACNFSNYLYTLSEELLLEKDLDFKLLIPLILETADKIREFSPVEVQTGPAVRNDTATIKKHLAVLENKPHLQELYNRLSEGIISRYRKS